MSLDERFVDTVCMYPAKISNSGVTMSIIKLVSAGLRSLRV